MSNNNKTSAKLFFAALTLAGFSVFQGLNNNQFLGKNESAPVEAPVKADNKRKADKQLTPEDYDKEAKKIDARVARDYKNLSEENRKEIADILKSALKGPEAVKAGALSDAEYDKAFDAAVQKQQKETPNANVDDIKASVLAYFKVKGITKAGAAQNSRDEQLKVLKAREAVANGLQSPDAALIKLERELLELEINQEIVKGTLSQQDNKKLEDEIKDKKDAISKAKAPQAKSDDSAIDVAQEARTVLNDPKYALDQTKHGQGFDPTIINGLNAAGGAQFIIGYTARLACDKESLAKRKSEVSKVSTIATRYEADIKKMAEAQTATDADKKAAKMAQKILEQVNRIYASIK